MKKLEDCGIKLHSAFRGALEKMYGYTSDARGIRHALREEPTLDSDDARFMLVSCSAFVNYLKTKVNHIVPVMRSSKVPMDREVMHYFYG